MEFFEVLENTCAFISATGSCFLSDKARLTERNEEGTELGGSRVLHFMSSRSGRSSRITSGNTGTRSKKGLLDFQCEETELSLSEQFC